MNRIDQKTARKLRTAIDLLVKNDVIGPFEAEILHATVLSKVKPIVDRPVLHLKNPESYLNGLSLGEKNK